MPFYGPIGLSHLNVLISFSTLRKLRWICIWSLCWCKLDTLVDLNRKKAVIHKAGEDLQRKRVGNSFIDLLCYNTLKHLSTKLCLLPVVIYSQDLKTLLTRKNQETHNLNILLMNFWSLANFRHSLRSYDVRRSVKTSAIFAISGNKSNVFN